MVGPRVPDAGGADDDADARDGSAPTHADLPCGERVRRDAFDLGMREYDCACGERHAVVLDVHPPSRFLPESVVEVLRESVEPSAEDAYDEFDTPHLLGVAMKEFPDDVVAVDAGADETVGYGVLWVTSFDARTLHERVVELVVELMDHAVSHARDDDARDAFEAQMLDFDVGEFVETYRAERDFDDEFDGPT